MPLEPSQTRLRDRPKKDVLIEYADPLGTLVAAIVLAFLAGVGVVKGELLAGVALAVLAALTGVSLRQRYVLEQAKTSLDAVPGGLAGVGETLRTALTRVERMIDAVGSNDPYEILIHEAVWSIEAPDGSLAYGKKSKRLRFNQNDVVSIYELSGTSGGRDPKIGDWEFVPDSIKKVDEMMIEGEEYILLSLGRRYGRNQELPYKSTRKITNLFVDERNHVSQTVREETGELRLIVQWPTDSPPKRVRVEELRPDGIRTDREIERADIPVVDDRPALERSYQRPPIGQKVVITWWL